MKKLPIESLVVGNYYTFKDSSHSWIIKFAGHSGTTIKHQGCATTDKAINVYPNPNGWDDYGSIIEIRLSTQDEINWLNRLFGTMDKSIPFPSEPKIKDIYPIH
jgi:hypothetical protein